MMRNRCLVGLVGLAAALSFGGVAPEHEKSAAQVVALHSAGSAVSLGSALPRRATAVFAKAPPKGTIVLGRSFPNASNTGVPDAIKRQLKAYRGSCTITAKNVRIDRKIITCDQLRLLGPRTRITNSIIRGTVYSDCCYLNGSYSLTDSEVHGPKATATVVGEARFELTRVEITGGSRSVFCNIRCVIRDSYLHGQYTDKRGIDHESGVRMDTGLTFVRNHVTCDATPVPPDAGCSAAITGYGDFGPVRNNRLANNLIDGGPHGSMGYCAYGGSTRGKPYPKARHVRFVNNIFRRGAKGKCGIWGPVTSFDVKAPGNVWKNNLWDDGKPVRATM